MKRTSGKIGERIGVNGRQMVWAHTEQSMQPFICLAQQIAEKCEKH